MKRIRLYQRKLKFKRMLPYYLVMFLIFSILVITTLKKKIDENIEFYQYQDNTINFSKFMFTFDKNDRATKIIRDALKNAFNEYYDNCAGYDEYRPNDKTCVNSFGFSSSMFEALDSLYMLNLKSEFQKAKNFIFNNFSCKSLQWINRKEFWSRCIGSLISSYILTKDKRFLSKANECSQDILFDYNYAPFINIKEKNSRYHNWISGISPVDIVAGLPELFSLSKLTKTDGVSLAYLEILNHLPHPDHDNWKLFNFYQYIDQQLIPTNNFSKVDGSLISFYQILAIAHSIRPMKSTEILLETIKTLKVSSAEIMEILNFNEVISTISKVGIYVSEVNETQSFPLVIDNILKLYDYPYNIFTSFSSKSTIPFNFDASVLRSIIMDEQSLEESRNKILNLTLHSLEKCKFGNGYSGLMKTNSEKIIATNIQHSNFFGQWIGLSSFLLTKQYKVLPDIIFNNRGHILFSKLIFPNQTDD